MRLSAVPLTALDALTAYSLWKLRQDVFVVEQTCPYPDLDGRDLEPATRQVVLQDDAGAVVGCARVLDDVDQDGPVWRIGRVALHPTLRGQGWSDRLMHAALEEGTKRGLKPLSVLVLDARGYEAMTFRRLAETNPGAPSTA